MADINLKTGNTDFVNISDGDVTIGSQTQDTSNDKIVLNTPIENNIITSDISTTDDLPEGSNNLYYTDARVDERINQADIVLDDVYTDIDFDNRLAIKTTDHLSEGNNNLYYTDARSRLAISVQGDLTYDNTTGVLSYNTPTVSNAVNSVNSQTGVVVLDTSHISENTNLYYTDTRARQAISVTGDLSYDNNTGVINYNTPTVSNDVNSVNAQTGTVVLDTSHIAENTNLYYTDARARQAISVSGDLSYDNSTGVISFTETPPPQTSNVNSVNGLTGVVTLNTDNISEGTNNLYYTDARVDARAQLKIDQILDAAPNNLDTLNELAAALGDDPNFATTVTNNLSTKLAIADFNSTFDNRLSTKSTTDIPEGTNLYYTAARIDNKIVNQYLVDEDDMASDSNIKFPTQQSVKAYVDSKPYYTDTNVDTHLNTSSALSGQVLSWNGTDYNWTLLPTAFDGQFSSLTNTPTTINGYGITDAIYNDSNVMAQPIRQHYANQSSFPSASTWHGAMAHSHSDGAMYYAHGGVWNKLANDSDVKSNLSELNDVNTAITDNGYLVYSIQSGTHNTQALHISHDTTPSLGGNLDTNSKNFSNGVRLSNNGIVETFVPITGVVSTIALSALQSHCLYLYSATNNKTLNITNLSLATNQGTNFTAIWNQGSTPYMITQLNINGSSVTINWPGGSIPTGTANGVDVITFSIFYTGSAYVVMGQSVSYS